MDKLDPVRYTILESIMPCELESSQVVVNSDDFKSAQIRACSQKRQLTSLARLCKLDSVPPDSAERIHNDVAPTPLGNVPSDRLGSDGEPAGVVHEQRELVVFLEEQVSLPKVYRSAIAFNRV